MKNKNIKTIIVTGLALVNYTFTQAQGLNITWGNETKKKNPGSTLQGVIQKSTNNYQFILGPEASNNNYQSYHILRNNFQHVIESNIDIPEKFNGKNVGEQVVFNANGKIISFITVVDQKTDIRKLYCLVIDETGKVINEMLVSETTFKTGISSDILEIEQLENKKEFLIIQSGDASKKGNVELNFKLIKDDLTLTWERKVTLPYTSKMFNMMEYQIDEENNIFIYGMVELDNKTNKKIILAYNPQNQKLEEKTIPFGSARSVSDVHLNYKNGFLNFIGFYRSDKEAIQGVVYTQLSSKDLSPVSEKLIPFSDNDMLKFTSEKSLAKEKGISANFDIRQVIIKESGDIFIAAEAYHQRTVMNGGDRETTYHYNDIMVIGISKSFELKWVTLVNKLQYSDWVSEKYNSFATLSDNQNIYLIYNDLEDNSSTKNKNGQWGDKKIETTYEGKFVITAATIDQKSGELKREIVYKPIKKEKPTFVPKYSVDLEDNKVLLYAERYNIYKFGVISIK